MNNKHLVLQAALHILLALFMGGLFIHAIDSPIHNSWLHWLMFAGVWPNVWIASKRWTVAYANV